VNGEPYTSLTNGNAYHFFPSFKEVQLCHVAKCLLMFQMYIFELKYQAFSSVKKILIFSFLYDFYLASFESIDPLLSVKWLMITLLTI
jgi:hypothetical protein